MSSQDGDPLVHPINNVSWFDAIEYCNRLSMLEGLTPVYSYGNHGTDPDNWPGSWSNSDDHHVYVNADWSADGFRLPNEMEREFSARGGLPAQTAGTFDDEWAGVDLEAALVQYAWYRVNAGFDLPGYTNHPSYGTHPVGTKLPNELELYDMSGNVSNWVWDIYAGYSSGSYANPIGPETGSHRVFRGGSWRYSASFCSVTYRQNLYPTSRRWSIGIRVSRNSQ